MKHAIFVMFENHVGQIGVMHILQTSQEMRKTQDKQNCSKVANVRNEHHTVAYCINIIHFRNSPMLDS